MSRAGTIREHPAKSVLTPAEQLANLARGLERLRPCWRDPRRYFDARAQLAHRLRSLAGERGRAAGEDSSPAAK